MASLLYLKVSQASKLLNITVDDDFGAGAAIVVPAPAIPHLETHLALFYSVPCIGLTVVRLPGRVDPSLNHKRSNPSH